MAKSSRSSVRKNNKAKLRDRVFGPAEMARTERLSAKLMQLASKPRPTEEHSMSVKDGSMDSPDTGMTLGCACKESQLLKLTLQTENFKRRRSRARQTLHL
jgi:hypothetical protein